MPARAATQVDESSRDHKAFVKRACVCLKEWVAREVGILLGREARGLSVLPEGAIHPLRHLPIRWHACEVHVRSSLVDNQGRNSPRSAGSLVDATSCRVYKNRRRIV